MQIEEKKIQFEEFLRMAEDTNFWSQRRLFRGVSDAKYRLIPSASRLFKPDRIADSIHNYGLFHQEEEDFRHLCSQYVDISGFSTMEMFVLAQHHGFPSPLLDWTFGPLVALFFASRMSVLDNGKFDHSNENDFAVYVFEEKKIGSRYSIKGAEHVSNMEGNEYKKRPHFFQAKAISPRIAAQQGVFSIWTRTKHMEENFPSDDEGITMHKYVFSASDRVKVFCKLNSLGIRYSTLFPDLDGLAQDFKIRRAIAIEQLTPIYFEVKDLGEDGFF